MRGRILVVIVVGVVWGLMTHGTFAGSGDEPHYLMIAHRWRSTPTSISPMTTATPR